MILIWRLRLWSYTYDIIDESLLNWFEVNYVERLNRDRRKIRSPLFSSSIWNLHDIELKYVKNRTIMLKLLIED